MVVIPFSDKVNGEIWKSNRMRVRVSPSDETQGVRRRQPGERREASQAKGTAVKNLIGKSKPLM